MWIGGGSVELNEALGANGGVSVQCLTLYIPDRDKNGKVIRDQRRWVLEGAELLARIGGGVTIMPPVEGGWVNDTGEIIWENPILIYTFIRPAEFLKLLPALRAFLHKLGRETRQGEVAFEFDGHFFRITRFDAGST
jgi:hypothetical protein